MTAPICGPTDICQDGSEGDACDGNVDCGPMSSHCNPDNQCQDGTDGDPCANNGDCDNGYTCDVDTCVPN
jgi:hypothetical protein